MSPPVVHIILVNWNGKEVTLDCLESLARITNPSLRIIVVDNASTDGSVAAFQAKFPHVTVLQMDRNLRFGGGNNAGIRHALALGAEFVLLLNNDTTVAPDFLTHMVSRMQQDKHTGMVVPKIYYHDLPDRIWYAGGEISFWTGTMSHRGIREKDHGQYDAVRETGYATGCCILARRSLIERIGLLDESFYIYTEDADWSMRARRAGYRIVYEPAARVWHKVSVSAGGHLSSFKLRNKFISNMRFFARYAEWYQWLVFPWANLLVNGIAALRYVLTRGRD